MPETDDLPLEYESFSDFLAQGEQLFGRDRTKWKLVCPACKAVISVQQWIDYAGSCEAAKEHIGYSCLGRLIAEKQSATPDRNDPIHKIRVGHLFCNKEIDYCMYHTCSLFDLNPVIIKENNTSFFQFAVESAKE